MNKYVAAIKTIACRAHYLAEKESRAKVTLGDLKRAIKESVIPSDSALANALALPLKRSRRGVAAPMQESFSPDEEATQTAPGRAINFADRQSAKLSVNRVSAPRIDGALLPG
jgi:hypothetical protein